MTNNDNTHQLTIEDKEITLIGTAHVSMKSAHLVEDVIKEEKPDTVCIELCGSRYQALIQKNRWQETDLLKVIKEKRAFLLLSNLMLASFQKKIGKDLGVTPGEEIIRAVQSAESVGAHIHLADRDIRTTLSRVWHFMGLWSKIKLIFSLIFSMGETDSIKKEDIEKLKQEDILETLLSDIGKMLPEIKRVLIDERDQYLAYKIRTAPGKKIVAIVGAGHVPGIRKNWEKQVDIAKLEEKPPKSQLSSFFRWGIPAAVIGLVIFGFFFGANAHAGIEMIKWWTLANAVLAGIGATIALAHPLTILSAVIASPITSLNPMIAAGWVAGMVEMLIKKPKVKDFENLSEDISSIKGFWNNKITRILLIVVFTNVGSSLGTFVAIPLMVKAFA